MSGLVLASAAMAGTASASVVPTASLGPHIIVFQQADSHELWIIENTGYWHGFSLMPGTSPSVAILNNGTFQIAFQSSAGELWTTGPAATTTWNLGMQAGTSPSITNAGGGSFEVAFQSNAGEVWSVGSLGTTDWSLLADPASSPNIS